MLEENPQHENKRTSPPHQLLLVYPEALVFLRGWRLELMIGPLVTGRIARVHAEKHLGTLILDEAWVSEIHVVPLDSSRLSASPQPTSAKTRMNTGEIQAIEARRQALLGQLRTAEAAVRAGLHAHGFGDTARAHLERALAHISEAYIAINENTAVRTVPQLVDDLNRIQQVMDDVQRRQIPTHLIYV